MKLFIDYKLIPYKESLPKEEFFLSWPAFLEYLDLRKGIFQNFPKFEESKTYSIIQSILQKSTDKDLVVRLYDELFAQVLTDVKSLPEIDPAFLLEKIQKKKEEFFFKDSLLSYGNLLTYQPYPVLHDLMLYLAWDRMCVYLGSLFDSPGSFQGLEILKDCLIESFLHIKAQKKCAPSFFRLVESLYSYFLREENIHLHSKEEWEVLSLGSIALRSRQELVDVPYVDESFASSAKVWTLDPKEHVKALNGLSSLIWGKIQKEHPECMFSQIFPEIEHFPLRES